MELDYVCTADHALGTREEATEIPTLLAPPRVQAVVLVAERRSRRIVLILGFDRFDSTTEKHSNKNQQEAGPRSRSFRGISTMPS